MKTGSTGSLCFVTVRHDLSVDGQVCVSEEQDLVYRDDPDPDAPVRAPKPAPTTSDVSRTVEPSEVLLFRYSALTFNGHRIHYDRDYATSVEGYPGLVVHGPLTATLLAGLAAEHGALRTFSFRGMAPLFDMNPFLIRAQRTAEGMDLWAETPSGGLAMQAEVTFED
jgi:3-methylfumaryl-CoA hydratase